MSSIISDIFYGSKQNLLDNYLLNRYQHQHQPSSLPNQQEPSAIYTPIIEFIISPQMVQPLYLNQHFLVKVQMGTKTDQNILQLSKDKNSVPIVMLALNDIEKQDLNRYTNIKLTVSEGKYKNKAIAYIPIQTIKNLASHHHSQKTTVLHLKGKNFIGFKTVSCKIRAEFPNNNILNSDILKSEYSSNPKQKDMSRENQKHLLSQKQVSYWNSHQIINHQTKPHQRIIPQSKRIIHHKSRRISNNLYIQESSNSQKSYYKKEPQPIFQYMRQAHLINIVFSQLNLKDPFPSIQDVHLANEQQIIPLNQTVELKNFGKQGMSLNLIVNQEILGTVHLSPLLLTLNNIIGQLPIYSNTQQYIGTLKIKSPSQTSSLETQINNHQELEKKQIERQKKSKEVLTFLVLNLDKLILINSSNTLDNDSQLNADPTLWQQFDFSTMEAINRLQIVVRIKEQFYKFNDITMKYLVNKDEIRIVQLKRKEGFSIQYKGLLEEQTHIEIEIYSNFRLITYSLLNKKIQDGPNHHFVGGQTKFSHCHCSIYIQTFSLCFHDDDLFQLNHMKILTPVIKNILTSDIVLNDTSDDSIKRIMNNHKKITYILIKKLMSILTPIFPSVLNYQNRKFRSILSQKYEENQHFIKFSNLILREVSALDLKCQQLVDPKNFMKILEFYRREYLSYESKELEILLTNIVVNSNQKVIYPFFVAGYYFQESSLAQIPKQISLKQQQSGQLQQIPHIKQIAVLAQPYYHLQKVMISNAHLLNNGKIPNCTLSISKKVHYSNSNPQFIIDKEINLLEPIIIYHKNIAHNDVTVLAKFNPSRRQIKYQLDLTGKAVATLVWGV